MATMSETTENKIGTIGWIDLTVDDAGPLREFYEQVVGWKTEPVEMGGYDDFTMIAPGSGEGVAGVCHARGGNAGLPATWMIYVTVEDVDRSAARVVELGGKILVPVKQMGSYGRYCVIEDPAGAASALFEPKA